MRGVGAGATVGGGGGGGRSRGGGERGAVSLRWSGRKARIPRPKPIGESVWDWLSCEGDGRGCEL